MTTKANERRLSAMRESWRRRRLPCPAWIARNPADHDEAPGEPVVKLSDCEADFRNPKCWGSFEQQQFDEGWLRKHQPGWLKSLELALPRHPDGHLWTPRFCPSCERIALDASQRPVDDSHGPDPLYPDAQLGLEPDERTDTDWMYG
jgi:hypothetical protein